MTPATDRDLAMIELFAGDSDDVVVVHEFEGGELVWEPLTSMVDPCPIAATIDRAGEPRECVGWEDVDQQQIVVSEWGEVARLIDLLRTSDGWEE